MANGRIILEPGVKGIPNTKDPEEFSKAVARLVNDNPYLKTKATIANAVRVRFQGQEGYIQLPFGGRARLRKATPDSKITSKEIKSILGL